MLLFAKLIQRIFFFRAALYQKDVFSPLFAFQPLGKLKRNKPLRAVW